MKRIRKFESFSNHRMPTKVTEDEWNRKWKIHGLEKLTEIEKEFFRQKFRTYILSNSLVQLEIPNIRYSIIKIKDDWYLIKKTCDDGDVEFFICDEWDEVLGYLSNINLKIS